MVDDLLNNTEQPLVFFALDWCEFSWSVRKLFKAIEAPCLAVALDAEEYQHDGLGGAIRQVLKDRFGATTVPQVFVAGHRVGGATDTFDAWNSGELQQRLRAAGVRFTEPPDLNPFELLPGWLHRI